MSITHIDVSNLRQCEKHACGYKLSEGEATEIADALETLAAWSIELADELAFATENPNYNLARAILGESEEK